MAKGDDKKNMQTETRAQAKSTWDRNNLQQSQAVGQSNKDIEFADSERSYLTDRYKGYAATGGIGQDEIDRLRGVTGNVPGAVSSSSSGGSSSGGSKVSNGSGAISTPKRSEYNNLTLNDYSQELAGFTDFSKTGGVDLSQALGTYGRRQAPGGGIDMSKYNASYDELMNLAQTGGVTQQDRDAIQRPLLMEYEKTGGYDDKQLADIRGRSNAAIPGFYNSLQDQLKRRRSVSGGYGGAGYDAASRAMTRDSAIESGNAARDTEVDIADKVRSGKLEATNQLSANELSLLGITTPAKVDSARYAGAQAVDMQKLIADVELAAANGDVEAQRIIQTGKLEGLKGMVGTKSTSFDERATKIGGLQQYGLAQDDIAARDRATRASSGANSAMLDFNNRSLNSQNERFLIDSQQRGRMYGDTGGLDLYNSAPAALGQSWNTNQNSIDSQAKAAQGYSNILYGNQEGSNVWGNVINAAGTGAAIYGGLRQNQNPSNAALSASNGYNMPSWV